MHSFNPKIVMDIGGHVGMASLYFHQTFPQAQVFAIERILTIIT